VAVERKGRGNVHIPSPCVVDHSCSYFDEPPDDPLDGGPHGFSVEGYLPQKVNEVVGEGSQEKPCFVGREGLAARLVPT